MAINLVRVLIILYTSFVVPFSDTNTLSLLNNNVVRLVVCALIVYLSFMDVITAVLLTLFVLTIHQGTKRVPVNNNVISDVEVSEEDNNLVNKINNISDVKVENYEDLSQALNTPTDSVVGIDETLTNNAPVNNNDSVVNDLPDNSENANSVDNVTENVEDIPLGLDTAAKCNLAL